MFEFADTLLFSLQEQTDSGRPFFHRRAPGIKHHALPGHGVSQPEAGPRSWGRRGLAVTIEGFCSGHPGERCEAELQAATHAAAHRVEDGAHAAEPR